MVNTCIICLSDDRGLYQMSESVCVLIKMILPELEISVLCWECIADVKRLFRFRKKALDSKNILDKQFKEGATVPTKIQIKTNLGITHIHNFTLCDNVFNTEETTKLTTDELLPGNTEPKSKPVVKEPSSKLASVIADSKIDFGSSKSEIVIRKTRKQKVKSKKRDVPMKQYVCSDCNKTFESRGKYEYHRQKHRGRVKCQTCGRDFSCRSALNSHASVAHSAAPRDDCYRRYCQPCAKFFKTDCGYMKHMRTSARHVDPETLRYTCPVCGRRFGGQEERDEHHELVHMRRGRLQCAKCYRQYCSVRALRSHVTRRHTPLVLKRDYICEVCGSGFKTAQVLKGHQRIHTRMDEVNDNSKVDSIE